MTMRTGEKLGAVLVRRGLLTETECDALLTFQTRQSSRKARTSPLRLGEILVRSGAITREKLEQALRRNKLSRRQIGDVLVESGYLRPEELRRGLHLQQRLLTATLVGMLAFTAVPRARAFDLPASRADIKMEIGITAEVKARSNMKFLRPVRGILFSQPEFLAPENSRLEALNSSPAGELRLATVDYRAADAKF